MPRFALVMCLLLAAAWTCGCPRKPEPTPQQRAEPPAEGRPPAAPQRPAVADASADWTPPLAHAIPPVNSTPVALPDALVEEHAGAELNADRSIMRITRDGKALWFQSFSLPGDDHEALQNYFTDALRRDGLSPNAEVSVQAEDRPGFYEGLWASADGRYQVRIYNPDAAPATGGGRPLIMAVTDNRPQPAADGVADVGEAQSFER